MTGEVSGAAGGIVPAARPTGGPGDIERAAMVVAEAFTGRAPPLGLDGALDLRGGDRASLERLALEFGFEWQHEFRDVVVEAAQRVSDGSVHWLTLPPLLVCGSAGVGRTHVARRFAYFAGAPHVVLDAAATGLGQIRQAPNGPDLLLPALPLLAMAVGGCANPVISVTGVENLPPAAQRELATMIDPRTARRWPDHATGTVADLTQVSWFIQAHDPGRIDLALARHLRPIELRWPHDADLPLHLVEVLAEAAIDLGATERVAPGIGEVLAGLRTAGRHSTAAIYERARAALGDVDEDPPSPTRGGSHFGRSREWARGAGQ